MLTMDDDLYIYRAGSFVSLGSFHFQHKVIPNYYVSSFIFCDITLVELKKLL